LLNKLKSRVIRVINKNNNDSSETVLENGEVGNSGGGQATNDFALISNYAVQEIKIKSMQTVNNMTSAALNVSEYLVRSVGLGLAAVGGVVLGKLESVLKNLADSVNDKKESSAP
jgi:hypothetical protein